MGKALVAEAWAGCRGVQSRHRSTGGRYFFSQVVGGAVHPPLWQSLAQEKFCSSFVVTSETQVFLILVFLVHLTMINQNVWVKLLRQSMDRFPSGLVSKQVFCLITLF